MRYAVEVTYKDLLSGETRRVIMKQSYKTRGGAERAAAALSYVTRPDGEHKTAESFGLVLLVP